MKKLYDVLPFLLLFILATGSVGLSCALERRGESAHGLPALSMNTGPEEDGRIHSPELFSRVERVYLFDRGDRKILPLSVLVNHALVDGRQIADFYDRLRERL